MDNKNTRRYCGSITSYRRRPTHEVRIGSTVIGGDNPIAVQSMTDTDTNDITSSVAQIGRIRNQGCRIVRLTAQGVREGESLKYIAEQTAKLYPDVALVADIHFLPAVALVAAKYVDKVRINPSNYNDKGGDFEELLKLCSRGGVSLRIGVNHGSLSERIVLKWGDTPKGMVASAMEFLHLCRRANFDQVVVSMKSSNTRVMVHAYRLLAAEMAAEGMDFPIHLGVTEAGNASEGRIKSAVGIGALLADGIGDTIRVSLTEPPENEIPVANMLVEYFAARQTQSQAQSGCDDALGKTLYNPFEYSRRPTQACGRLGGSNIPLLFDELNEEELKAIEKGDIALLTADGVNPVGQWRGMLAQMDKAGDRRPVILHRKYEDTDAGSLMIKAAADFGVMFIDGLADGIYIESSQNLLTAELNEIALNILQASRTRTSKTEYIACPGCGRTLFDLHHTLDEVKARTRNLAGLKIGVMGCIVNGPGEMADADYGYVGAGRGRISLYRGRELIRRDIPQEEALDALEELIKSDGKWQDNK